jgi:hypothetical protein
MESSESFKSLCPERGLPKAVEFQYASIIAATGFSALQTFSKRYRSSAPSEIYPHPSCGMDPPPASLDETICQLTAEL